MRHDPGAERPEWLQQNAAIRFDWGRAGAARSAAAGCITVIVDTLSFSTIVAVAVQRGIAVVPAISDDEADAIAHATAFRRTVSRAGAPSGALTLSPASMRDAVDVSRALVVHSPNGARCTRAADGAPAVFVGTLVNASATAAAVDALARSSGCNVTVIACGERWHRAEHDEGLRFAIEDLLGAGAIIARLTGECAPEAEIAARAYHASAGDLAMLIAASGSGRELASTGFAEDVRIASALDSCDCAAVVGDGSAGRAIYAADAVR
jgi:2-phosphosulfolactate phosphatase